MRPRIRLTNTLLELTLRCNMHCIHCGSAAGTQRGDELTLEEWKTACNSLADLHCKTVTLMGGEPLVYKNWLTIAEHVRNLDMNFTLMSNGYLIDEHVIEQLRRLEPYGVAISIDGGSAQTHDAIRGIPGSFDRCLHTLQLLRDANLPTTVVTTVHKQNFHDFPLLRDRLVDTGVAWQLQLGTPFGRFPAQLALSPEEFYAVGIYIASTRKQFSTKRLPVTGAHCMGYYSKHLPNLMLSPWTGCLAGLNVLGIQSNGGVKGCLSLTDEFIEGNIRTQTLESIWSNPQKFPYTRGFSTHDLTGECQVCRHGNRCRGGCASASVSFTGKPHGDTYCLHLIENSMNI